GGWTPGTGPMPASALAEHPQLVQRESAQMAAAAAARAPSRALELLGQQLATLVVSREAAPEIEALERGRAQLTFAAAGEARADRGERDLDRLLTEETNQQKRAALDLAEAKAAQEHAPLALDRDTDVAHAFLSIG